MKRSTLVFFAAFLINCILGNAQTVDEIIDKYADTIGGRETLKKISSLQSDNSLNLMGGDINTHNILVPGKYYKEVWYLPGDTVINCVNEKNGWLRGAGNNKARLMTPAEYNAARIMLYLGGPAIDYKKNGYKAELLGKEKVGKVDTYKIKLTSKEGKEFFYYINSSSYYLEKEQLSAPNGGSESAVTNFFSNYKKTDIGYVMPYQILADYVQFKATAKLQTVEFNKPIDTKIFDMPTK